MGIEIKKCAVLGAGVMGAQIAGHIADGHTRITRKPSVCLVGPEGFDVLGSHSLVFAGAHHIVG